MAFETPHDSGGILLTWNPTTGSATTAHVYTVTNIVISYTDPTAEDEKINVAHLGQTVGELAKTLDLPLAGAASGDTGRTVQFDYVGMSLIEDKQTGTITISYGPTASRSTLVGKGGTVQSSTLTLATQDAVRGQATIRIVR
jgi:hypothetical protein